MANVLWIKNPAASASNWDGKVQLWDLGFSIPLDTTIIITDAQQGFIEELQQSRSLRELVGQASTAVDGTTDGYLHISADGTNFFGRSVSQASQNTAFSILESALRRIAAGSGFDSPNTDSAGKLDAILKLGSAGLSDNAGATITAILDQDDMSSNSATALASQQSIKAYVDSVVSGSDLDFAADSGSSSVDLDSQTFTIAGGQGIITSLSGQTLTARIDLGELTAGLDGDGSVVLADDQMLIWDNSNSNHKKLNFAQVSNLVFGQISGDASVADGGALTIGANAVQAAMLHNDCITGQSELVLANIHANGHILGADHSGNKVKVGNDSIRDWIFTHFSGDATVAAGGALTIAAGAVENSMLADDAVNSDEIADGAIDLAHMSANSVDSAQYVDASIDTAHIGNDQITNALMADNAIDSAQLVAGSVDNAHLADDAVGADELAANAVVNASVASNAAIAANKVDFNVDMGGNFSFGNQSDDLMTVGGSLTVTGDLIVSGDTVTVNTATMSVEDPLIILASGNAAADVVDIGLYGLYDTSGSQDLYGGLFRDANDQGKWKLFKDNQAAPTTVVNTAGTGYTVATLVASLEGDVTGDVTGNADTATILANARTLGGVSFNGSANIDLPGVNSAGNQDTSGLAATATVLASARTIAGVSFNGSANIALAPTDLTSVDATAAELNLIHDAVAGTVVNSKAVIYSASGEVNATEININADMAAGNAGHLKIGADGDLQMTYNEEADRAIILMNTLNADMHFQLKSSGGDWDAFRLDASAETVNIPGHNGSNKGLMLGSALVTATAAELNYLDVDALNGGDLIKLAAVEATADELNIMDGSATTQATVTLAAGDGIVISDGDVMKQCLVSDLSTYLASADKGINVDGTTLKINAYARLMSLEFTHSIPKARDAGDNSLTLKLGGLSSDAVPMVLMTNGKVKGISCGWDEDLLDGEGYNFCLQQSSNGGQTWAEVARNTFTGSGSEVDYVVSTQNTITFTGGGAFSAGNMFRCVVTRLGGETDYGNEDPRSQSSWNNIRVSAYILYSDQS